MRMDEVYHRDRENDSRVWGLTQPGGFMPIGYVDVFPEQGESHLAAKLLVSRAVTFPLGSGI